MGKEEGDEIEKEVTFWGMKQHIFVEAPNGNEALWFYRLAFGARKVYSVSEQRRRTPDEEEEEEEEKEVVSAELKFGPNSIIVSELTHDSALVNNNSGGSGSGMRGSVIWLEMEEMESVVATAVEFGAVCEEGCITTTHLGRLAKIKDPYGNLWIIRSPPQMPSPPPHMDG